MLLQSLKKPSRSSSLIPPHFNITRSNQGSILLQVRDMADLNQNKGERDAAASMLGGHARFAKGYVEEGIGNVTGSKEWQESGKKTSKEGVEEMKAANANKPEPAASGMGGKLQEMAGSATGCPGMEEEGKKRQDKAKTP